MALRGAGNELALRKPSLRKGLYELRAGGALVGLLDVRAWTSAASARTLEEAWRFERPRGFSQRTVRIRRDGDEAELTSFLRTWSGRGGAMDLGGRAHTLQAEGLWKPTWIWRDDAGTELAHLTTRNTFRDERGRVTLTEAGLGSPDAPLLALLGAHLALLSGRESSASAAAGASS